MTLTPAPNSEQSKIGGAGDTYDLESVVAQQQSLSYRSQGSSFRTVAIMIGILLGLALFLVLHRDMVSETGFLQVLPSVITQMKTSPACLSSYKARG